jgi:Family of unknown function (DUF6338)
MDFKEFTFRVVLLFLPGLVGFILFERLTVHKKTENFLLILYSLVFGFAAYGFTWGAYSYLFPWINSHWLTTLPTKMVFWDELQDANRPLEFREIAAACLSAICVAIIASYLSNYKVLYRVGRFFRATRKSGSIDVWGAILSASGTDFVTIRDKDADLAYDGWIYYFSEEQPTMELVLRDVAVYRNSDAVFLYQVGAMYFKLDPKKIALEFRGIKISDKFKLEAQAPNEKTEPTGSGGNDQRGPAETGGSQSGADKPASSAATRSTASQVSAAATSQKIDS